MGIIDNTPIYIFLIAAFTLGLGPFVPEPHIWEKLKMLMAGTLVKPADIFDFIMHGAPWVLLAVKIIRMVTVKA